MVQQSGSENLYVSSEKDITLRWILGDASTIFLATSFTQKMQKSSDSMYFSIFMLENICYHSFT